MIFKMITAVLLLLACQYSTVVNASSIDEELQALKREVVALNRDLFVLEEELLFPASTQLAVFLSTNVGHLFQLDSVELILDDETLTHYLYTPHQQQALERGGVQRLYTGNIRAGSHHLLAVFRGKGPEGRDYRRAAELQFDKGDDKRVLELRVTGAESTLQPQFSIDVW